MPKTDFETSTNNKDSSLIIYNDNDHQENSGIKKVIDT